MMGSTLKRTHECMLLTVNSSRAGSVACLAFQDQALTQHRGAVSDNLTFSADLVCKQAAATSGDVVVTANFRYPPDKRTVGPKQVRVSGTYIWV